MAGEKNKNAPSNPDDVDKDQETLEELQKKAQDLESQLGKKDSDLEAVTSELISTRKKMNEYKNQIPDEPPSEDEVDKKIKSHLEEDKKRQREVNQNLAWNEFIKQNPAFSKENDESGLRKQLLEEKLSRLNTGDHFLKEEILDDLNDAYKLLKDESSPSGDKIFPSGSTPKNQGGEPPSEEPKKVKFSEADLSFIKGLGLDPDKIAKRIKDRGGA